MTVNEAHEFPLDPVLVKLLLASKGRPGSDIIIHDICGHDKSYSELLGDILHTRNALRERLPDSIFDEHGLMSQDTPYVSVLTRSGYEYLVAFFAIRAIGGACIPFGKL